MLKRSWRKPRSIALLIASVLVVWMVGDQINVLWGSGPRGSVVFGRVAYESILQVAALLCIARGVLYAKERGAWIAIGVGCMAWGAGDIYFQAVLAQLKEIPIPSPADGGYLAFYPLVFAGATMLLRARSGRTGAAQWLDGLTAALAAAALSAAVGFATVLGSIGGRPLADAINLAYPFGDLIVLGVIAGALVVCGVHAGRAWPFAALGIGIFCLADALYLVHSAQGTYQVGSWFDVLWPAGVVLLAIAAWSDPPDRAARFRAQAGGLRRIALPLSFALVSIGLLLYAGSDHLNWASRILAAASLGIVLLRLGLTFREITRITAQRELESRTDALTGLGNRRALNADLAAVAQRVTLVEAAVVATFDLDGFKHYNDTFGHQAGDALLTRLSTKLRESAPNSGAYRMGGDEFCVLIEGREGRFDDAVQRAAAALVEIGDGFTVRSSYGVAHMPAEACDAESALQLADQRMYDHKGAGRVSATRQSRDVLLQALREHAPDLGDHTQGVRELAEAVAQKLGLDNAEIERVGNTAALHDIGKMGVPRAILNKPGPLDGEEWGFMRRHTIIGERIVRAAPALADVATAVRATHECWDGTGYPDGLAGDDIPLAARIVDVCDAFDAMISDRPYAASRSTTDAFLELQHCSGSQFDPAIVNAFEQVLTDRLANPAAGPAPGAGQGFA